MTKAFEGVRVIDFTQVLSGPVATANMALLGADVIKIEMKGIGDQTRNLMAEGEWALRAWSRLCRLQLRQTQHRPRSEKRRGKEGRA